MRGFQMFYGIPFNKVEDDWARAYLSSYNNNLNHPFCGYYGNDSAIESAMDIAYKAYMSYREEKIFGKKKPKKVFYRICQERIAIYAPMSVGKTEFAKRFAKVLRTPFVELDGCSLTSVGQLIDAALKTWDSDERVKNFYKKNYVYPKLKPYDVNSNLCLDMPAMIIFIDEVHRVNAKIQDELLKITEKNDGNVEYKGVKYNFQNVCFIVATTDSGKMRPAFKSRFLPIVLERPNKYDLIKILLDKYPQLDYHTAHTIAGIRPISREAIAFAEWVIAAQTRNNLSQEDAIEMVRIRMGITVDGLTKKALFILNRIAESNGGLSRASILSMCDNMENEEFEQEILPQLIPPGKEPLIVITNKHKITEAGVKACNQNR